MGGSFLCWGKCWTRQSGRDLGSPCSLLPRAHPPPLIGRGHPQPAESRARTCSAVSTSEQGRKRGRSSCFGVNFSAVWEEFPAGSCFVPLGWGNGGGMGCSAKTATGSHCLPTWLIHTDGCPCSSAARRWNKCCGHGQWLNQMQQVRGERLRRLPCLCYTAQVVREVFQRMHLWTCVWLFCILSRVIKRKAV